MEITCTACNKLYKNAKTYKAHIKMNKCKIYDNSLECKICNKIFSNKYNRKVHENKCGEKKDNEIIIAKLNEIDKLIKTQGCGSTNIQNNNIQNNNHIHITCNFGNEDMSYISIKDIISMFDKGEQSIEALVKYKHFNLDVPQNCNVYIKNLNNKYAFVFDNNKWEIMMKSDVVEKLYTSNSTYLRIKFQELQNELSKTTLMKFQKFLDDIDNYDTIEPIMDRIKCILYNNKDMILELNKIQNIEDGTEILMITSDQFE